ncbi:MAG: ATP synthase F1 subunit delta [Bacteroidota bacterium]|nr:ATP synthase F1 subunit delta [Bacteroidota bacterium]
MIESTISVRYAKALFMLALEKDIMESVQTDIQLIKQSLDQAEQLSLYLKSPVVKPSEKRTFISDVFGGKVNEISLNFINLLITNKREAYIDGIIHRFLEVYREHKGIKSALITTAVPLDETVRAKLNELLSKVYKTGINLETQQNSSIIGGFVLKVGDHQYDASVASGLKRMSNTLFSTSTK